MSDSNLSAHQQAANKIAAARAARVPVDHNGQPLGPAATYTYDAHGRLVEATSEDA